MEKEEKTFQVRLTTLVYGGDAMGRLPDGRAVFVPGALPDELVRLRLLEEKRGHARAELMEVLEASPDRVAPACGNSAECGGCHYQHMSYDAQLRWKTEILRDQLTRIGGIKEAPIKAIIPSPKHWHYRNHVQFHLAPDGRLGFQMPNSHTVVPIEKCCLCEEVLDEVSRQLDLGPVPGLDLVSLRVGAGDEVMMVLEGQDPQPPEFDVDIPISALYIGPEGSHLLSGDTSLIMEVLERPFRVSADSFFQVNTQQAEAMVRHLLEKLPLNSNATVLDVYCGVGLFSAWMAPKVKRLIGVELSPSACQDFAVNLNEFDHVELYQGAAEDVLPALDVRPDVVVLDPPRAGLERRALEAIVERRPALVAYVSCDPATLSRDLKRFIEAGYMLTQVTPFDLFPQTYHIETIVLLKHND